MGTIKKVVGAGAGLAAVAALGAYWFSAKGRKKRAEVRGWVLKVRGEVLERVENLKHVNKDSYHRILDQVTRRYHRLKNVNKRELKSLAGELKNSWSVLRKEFSGTTLKKGKCR